MSAREAAATAPGQAARAQLEAAVRAAITENRDCRGSIPCGLCERRVTGALAAVDAYVAAAAATQPAPGLADAFPAAQAALARVLSWFKPEDKFDSYRYARATRAQLAHARQDGGLDVPDELRRFL